MKQRVAAFLAKQVDLYSVWAFYLFQLNKNMFFTNANKLDKK